MIEEHKIFPTLVASINLSDNPYHQILKDLAEKTSLCEHDKVLNGQSSYDESKENKWIDHLLLKDFKKLLQNCIDGFTEHYGVENLVVSNSWINTLNTTSNIKLHRHQRSVISGAYYITANKGSCPLIFRSPLQSNRMNEYITDITEYNTDEIGFTCKEGYLILFPSWLEHYTERNNSDSRITLSFNTTYRKF